MERINPLVLNKTDFSLMVEEKALAHNIPCLEIITDMIEKDSVAIDSIPDLLSDHLLKKIEAEARNLNLLKKTGGSVKTLFTKKPKNK